MKLLAAAVCIIIGLTGCSGTVPVKPVEPTRVDPSWPEPIAKWDGKWQVVIIDGKAWVGMPYEESQEFRVWLNDVSRYVQDANGMICYYRAPLKEPKCQ